MSVKSSDKKKRISLNWQLAVALPLWVVVSFGIAQAIVIGLLLLIRALGVSFVGMEPALFSSVVAAVVYLLSLVLVIGVPWWIKKRPTTKTDLGLQRLMSWTDIALAPAGAIVYLFLTMILVYAAAAFLPGFDPQQVQETGFSNLDNGFEYLLAFVTLIILAPVAEEILFRGYLYGKLRRSVPVWLAALITSLLFGIVHGQWNVGIDVFALSLVLCALREVTGGIWAGILLHMMKNSLAFYILFINPSLLNTMG